jgi:hypothetical protein
MGVTTIENRLTANAGDIRRELVSLRRKRALFQLSIEGENTLVLTDHPELFAVAASYEDYGYRNEPLRAKIIAMNNTGSHVSIPFEGVTPSDLIDAMIKACRDCLASRDWHSEARTQYLV